MKYLSDYVNALSYFSDKEFELSQYKLQENMKQKSFYRQHQHNVQKGETITVDYSNENQRRSYFWDCIFKEANLTNTGMSGSIFKSVNFKNCIIFNTKLDSSDFEDCLFTSTLDNDNLKFHNLNLSKSTIINTKFVDCNIIGANYTDSVFVNTTFENCIWQSLALENCVFKNTTLDSVVLKKLNFEYAEFDGIKLNNIRLPFPTIPYIFNGLEYIMTTNDKVYISSANSKTGKISTEQYLTYLHDLEVFYSKTQNYFPLANIYISTKQSDKAYAAIIMGINFSLKLHSFRTVYYFCKLLQNNNCFTDLQKSNAYNFIMENLHINGMVLQDQFKIHRYIEPIRNLLLNERNGSSLEINLITNIEDNEYAKLSILLEIVDEIVKYTNTEFNSEVKYYVDVRHHCPFEVFIKLFSEPTSLITIAGAFHLAFTGLEFIFNKAVKFRNDLNDSEIKKEQLIGYRLDNQLKKKSLEEKEIDIALKRQSLDSKSSKPNEGYANYIQQQHNKIQNNNITIIEGHQNLFTGNYEIEDKDFYYINY